MQRREKSAPPNVSWTRETPTLETSRAAPLPAEVLNSFLFTLIPSEQKAAAMVLTTTTHRPQNRGFLFAQRAKVAEAASTRGIFSASRSARPR